ncbi:tlde1 domain-containing protein [Xanthobacter sediminis]
MAEPIFTTDPDEAAPQRRWRTPHIVAAGLVGVSVVAVAAVAATTGFARIEPTPRVDGIEMRSVAAGPRTFILATAADPVSRADGLPSAGALAIDSYWILGPGLAAPAGTFAFSNLAASSDPERDARIASIIIESVPVPSRNPLMAGRLPEVEPRAVPLPLGNPLLRGRRQLASLTPGDLPEVTAPPASHPAEPQPSAPAVPDSAQQEIPLPTPGSGFALYDIEGRTLYMPDGEKLEAHSGYGEAMDDIKQVALKMRGPTPPNVYTLRPREALFHGVETLRLTPVGGGKMYGRDGFLVHPFMMGPRGDSNGCISVKDHTKILDAYRRGEVKKLVVVARLPNSQKPAPSLLSWLLPKQPIETPTQ